MIGERIRQTRLTQQRSLADVAGKADISVATLSRIENNKQALDLDLFLRISKILKIAAADLLGEETEAEKGEPLVRMLASLGPAERTKVWRDLAGARRNLQPASKRRQAEQITAQVEELLAQIDFVRNELEAVRKRIRREPTTRRSPRA